MSGMATQAQVLAAIVTTLIGVAGVVWAFYRKVRKNQREDALSLHELVKKLEGDLVKTRDDANERDQKHFQQRRELVQQVNDLQDRDTKRETEIGKLRTQVSELNVSNEQKDARIRALEQERDGRTARETERETQLQQVKSYVIVLESHVGVLTERLQAAGIEVPPMPEAPPAQVGRRRKQKKSAY